MNRLLLAATIALFGGTAGSADACAFCGGFFSGYGPYTSNYGGGYGTYAAGYGPSAYTAGYGPAMNGPLGLGIVGPNARARRQSRRAYRRSLWSGMFGNYGYGGNYAPATFSAGYAPATYGGYGAAYGPALGVSGCGSCGTPAPACNSCQPAAQPSCGCSGGNAGYAVSAPSSCPNGSCGAGYAPPERLSPIPAVPSQTYSAPTESFSTPTDSYYAPAESYSTPTESYSNPTPIESYSVPSAPSIESAPLYESAPTYNSSPSYDSGLNYGTPIDPQGPPQLPPNATDPTPWYVKPENALDSPGDSDKTFNRDSMDNSGDSDFRPAPANRRAPDRMPRNEDRLLDDDTFNEPLRGGGSNRNNLNRGGGGLNDDMFDLNDGSTDAYKPTARPVKPKKDRSGAADVSPRTLDDVASRSVGSGVKMARSRTIVRARYSLPRRVARRYDLERGEYSGPTRRVAAKP